MTRKKEAKLRMWLDAIPYGERKHIKLEKRKYGTYYLKYCVNKDTNKWTAISTGLKDKHLADKVRTEASGTVEFGDTELGLEVSLRIAKLEKEAADRTWGDVFDAVIRAGLAKSTQTTYKSTVNSICRRYPEIKEKKLVETTKGEFEAWLEGCKAAEQRRLITIYNHARDKGWLLTPNLVPQASKRKRLKVIGGLTASITAEMHNAILGNVGYWQDNWVLPTFKEASKGKAKDRQFLVRADKQTHQEFYHFLEILWELGASNMDARTLTIDNINWDGSAEAPHGHIVFKRQKWSKENGKDRLRQAIYWPISKTLKNVIQPLYVRALKRKEGQQFLLPNLAKMQSCNVGSIFKAYAKRAGVKLERKGEDGVTRQIVIHSYRYAMAERLYLAGYTEREAQMLMGHNSKEVHWAYAKHARMQVKPLDMMESNNTTVIKAPKIAA